MTMRHTCSALRALPLLLVLAAGFAVPASAQVKPLPPVRIGFVDMETIIEKHPDTKSASEQIKQEFNTRVEALKQEADKMRALRDDLDILKVGSPEHLEQLKQIRLLEATLELDQKILRIELDLKLVAQLKDIYKRCQKVVGEVAAKRGLTIVAMYSSSEVDGRSRRELIGDIVTRPFIYHASELDITEDVLKALGAK